MWKEMFLAYVNMQSFDKTEWVERVHFEQWRSYKYKILLMQLELIVEYTDDVY